MSLLLDSNVLLWWFAQDGRLGEDVLLRIELEPRLLISFATPWELWIKAAAGKLQLPPDLETGFNGDDLTLLAPTLADLRLAARLPLLHRDPFDRMIIAQALNNRATVLTSDRRFAEYGVDVIAV